MIRTNASKLGLVATTLLALYPAASWAQETPTEDAPAEGEAAVPEEGQPEAAPEGEPEATPADASAPTRWPRAVIARPLTLPGSVFQAGADIGANNDFSVLATKLVGGYGINDKLEATVFYAFALKDFEAKGSLDVNVGYAAIRGAAGGKLEVVPRAQVGYGVLAEAINPLLLGAQVQYNVSDKLAVITPGGQLSIALDGDPKPITLGLPVAVGYQVTPEIYAQVDTSIGSISIADSANAFIFADSTPLALTGIYNVKPAIDVSAGVALNVTPADPLGVGDTLAFLVGVRYYGGTL